jgi:tol-pal system protein YbgF
MKQIIVTLTVALISSSLMAQPLSPVVDLNGSSSLNDRPKPSAESLQRAEQFYQIQVLQDEVRTLRGTVEELSYQLQQIKQLQMDDYLDLDRRLIAISQSTPTPSSTTQQNLQPVDSQQLSQTPQNAQIATEEEFVVLATAENMEADYLAASLLLKERDFEGAIEAFKGHIQQFPESPFSANAYYWLGEVYEFQGSLDLALDSFHAVVDNYASHNKAMDARYKLGKLYHKQGDKDKALVFLQQAASTDGGAGAKAKAYIKAKGL